MFPLPTISRIVSFNVESTSQLAHLRHVSRSFHKSLMVHLGAGGGGSIHHIRCPSYGSDVVMPFLQALCVEEEYPLYSGDLIDLSEVPHAPILQGATPRNVRVVAVALSGESKRSSSTNDDVDPPSIEKIIAAYDKVELVESMDDMLLIASEISEYSLANPLTRTDVGKSEEEDEDREYDDSIEFTGLLTLSVDPEVAVNSLQSQNGQEWLELTTFRHVEGSASHCLSAVHQGCSYRAPVVSRDDDSWTVVVLMKLTVDHEGACGLAFEDRLLESLLVKTPWDKAQKNDKFVEGITIVDDFFAGRESLCNKIDALRKQQDETDAADYHPNSNGVVRNLVHPALYCYVDNVTPTQKPIMDATTPSDSSETLKDFWGRPYENSVYQWLPTYFSIAEDGSCVIEDYINNLVPRENAVNAALYKDLEKLFDSCLPFIESTYSYVQAIRPHLRDHEEELEYDDSTSAPPQLKHCSLRGKKLQVITKIVDYNLLREQTHTGVWHVEGMSHEEIVLTALYIADRDDDFVGADIQFKRAYLRREAEYLFSTIPQCRPGAIDNVIAEGLIPLGTVSTLKGRLIVFPNSHVHKVSEMSFFPTSEDRKSTNRRIVVFFLVNPLKRTVSTREVAPQQMACGGKMSHQDAVEYRRQLMHERRHTKQDWNVREIELCEH